MRRSERLLRAVAAACMSTGVALGMHVAGGGSMPAAPGIVVPLALAFVVSAQLASVAMSRWRLALAVIASQAAFHATFVFGAGGSLGVVGNDPHAAHDAGSLVLDSSGIVAAHHHTSTSPAMLAAHALAAVVTYVLLRRADVLLAWGARLARALWSRLALPAVPLMARPAVRAAAWTPTLTRTRVASTPRLLRGPPVALSSDR